MDCTFCFLVTKDLNKEHIWRAWFDRLRELNFKFKVITHCSLNYKKNIHSDWLNQTVLPDEYLHETKWAWILKALLSMYKYAITHSPSSWYTFHSESCVPLISPEKFIENFIKFKHNTFLGHCKAWWTPMNCINDRANLHLLPKEYHLAHQHLSILCHEDLTEMISLSESDTQLTNILINGHTADESWIAIFLFKINNFKNVINKATTLVDWKRASGANPYTFNGWDENDKSAVAELRADVNKNEYMFIRKIGVSFPDDVLKDILGM
jgi:hypothetical protein